jgi:hypothetical protein
MRLSLPRASILVLLFAAGHLWRNTPEPENQL